MNTVDRNVLAIKRGAFIEPELNGFGSANRPVAYSRTCLRTTLLESWEQEGKDYRNQLLPYQRRKMNRVPIRPCKDE